MTTDMLTTDELGVLHRKLCTAAISMCDRILACVRADPGYWRSADYAVLHAAAVEIAELAEEIHDQHMARLDADDLYHRGAR